MKKITYLLLPFIIISSSCDKVNSDFEAPMIEVAPIHYFQKGIPAIIGIYSDDIDFSNAELQTSNHSLEIIDESNIENGLWLRYTPSLLSSEPIEASFYNNNALLGSASFEMVEFIDESNCIRASFSDKYSYQHSQFVDKEDKSLVIDIMENDEYCGIDWSNSIISIYARGSSLGSREKSLEFLNQWTYKVSPGEAIFTFEPRENFIGEYISYYTLVVYSFESVEKIFPKKDFLNCQDNWFNCLTEEEQNTFHETIFNDYKGELSLLYSNASVEITITD